ncbi:MAG TPA: ATP-binding protein [Rhodocyclaceae bacterium]|jgi:two-component system osmolarity sensor histidine kinase EnvZ|nr:ATP-binding protein [Rhodocyclaceae bacterium]HMV20559.1 ATP-binding protein [Rhodocyclaceae bacterium]HMW77880.1 ATP-binding protein [Rhodocyclaceae bacterium]HNE43244.1 ATP-binding protein [Rhodocyclaceae bacterium]HNM79443.1 ATP-binding protein [Rhodocyclaceae bacterium]
MKLPGSLLARTFFLIAALVLLTTASWLVLFERAEAEPRARETAQLASSTVNLIRAALLASAPERRPDLFVELMTREGIRLLPAEPGDQLEPLPNDRFIALVRERIEALLGSHTRLSLAVNEVPGFWVSFRLEDEDEDEYWLILPQERALRTFGWHWLAWGLVALALALGVAWYMASRITKPLKALGTAASAVGRGLTPEVLPESGADELRHLAAAFNRMAADLARHDRDRAEVLAGISHDLRTPLTRLRLEAELSIASETARDAVSADIDQMEAVIAQFMDYARGDGGEVPIPLHLDALLADVIGRQRALGRELGGKIENLPPCVGRPRALSRAVTNLIDNAYKYGAAPVDVYARREGRRLVVEVADRGEGIPPDEAEGLKRPFARRDSARSNATGTGLGLAIVERTVRLHGGSLELLPREGGGLLARISLDLAEASGQ